MSTTNDILNHPRIASRTDWLESRLALLEREKAITRERDRLNQARRELPMVRIEQDYVFQSPEGPKALAELFAG